ncbi:ribosome production factor 1-like [Limulus polyphemus]|uniref:Ribosome production factor 1-like n=1 Tax=Limulus polyphemus TaxID=6850 RepID=A0ABM1BJM9_LIMPO|nr:ribosome production factor 1-like [Limulus polyphemus]
MAFSSGDSNVPESVKNADFEEPDTSLPKTNISKIRNKMRRMTEYVKLKKEKQRLKRIARKKRLKEAKALGDSAPPKKVPKTIENTREPDDAMVDPQDEEVQFDEAMDEMAAYFNKDYVPKVLVTSSDNPHTRTIRFCRELKQTIPNAEFRWRNRASVKKMVKGAIERGFSDIVLINEDRRHPNGMLLVHLPDGPTAHFKISNTKLCREVKHHATWSEHRPEVILNNFNTRLGHTVARMLASIFHYEPQFRGRRVVTFHNQRDYIFFRHHRYEFKNEKRAAIQEIGPKFTLKLRSLQKGTFDSKFGEYEWVLKRHQMETSRRRFFL